MLIAAIYAASVFDDARLKGDRRGGGAERNAVAWSVENHESIHIRK